MNTIGLLPTVNRIAIFIYSIHWFQLDIAFYAGTVCPRSLVALEAYSVDGHGLRE